MAFMSAYRPIAIALIALALGVAPSLAQNILAPIEQLVDQLVPQETLNSPAPPPKRAPSVKAEAVAPPPLPRPRPVAEDTNEAKVDASGAGENMSQPEPGPSTPAPPRNYQAACPALLSGAVIGRMLPSISEGICGERSPLEVTALMVNGKKVSLSAPVVTNCAMAGAFAQWAEQVDAYAGAALKSELAGISTGTSQMCRNRRGDGSDFVSEHSFANAVDITGFILEDGRVIALPENWGNNSTPEQRLMRHAHGTACGLFTTVLGPDANDDHLDHLHLDLGCHGASCTAQICE